MAKLKSTPTTVRVSKPTGSGGESVLAREAATLAPGFCRRLTTHLTGADLTGDGDEFLKWGNTGWYDPGRKEIGWIGKRASPYPYKWLVYDEVSNSWTNSRSLWSPDPAYGHGYDHSAFDPTTGTLYHRPYGSDVVHVWRGAWSSFSGLGSAEVVGGLEWFPGVGLIYADGRSVQRYSGGLWTTIQSFGGDSYHDVAEYNAAANVVIFGGGNSSPLRKLAANMSVSLIANSPFAVGAGTGQGILVSDPSSARMIAFSRSGGGFTQYNILSNTWSSLPKSSGSGASPQAGAPALIGNAEMSAIAIEIPEYNVIMFIQYMGPGTTEAPVWLYKHS